MSDEPCTCHDCVVANVGRPAVTIPACRYREAETLHGVALRDYYKAQDELKAKIAELRQRPVASRDT